MSFPTYEADALPLAADERNVTVLSAFMEYGGGGSRTGELVADIFNAYFFERSGGMILPK